MPALKGQSIAMSAELYLQLQWLPPAPGDWRERVRHLDQAPEVGREIQHLATHALTISQLDILGRAIGRLRPRDSALTPFRLGIASNATIDHLVPQLVASAARHGIALECVAAPFDQVMQEALDPRSTINQARCDAVLLALDHRALLAGIDLHAPDAGLQAAQSRLAMIRRGFLEHGGAPSIVQSLAPPPETLFGNYERRMPGTVRALTHRFNEALVQSLSGSPDHLLDVEAMAQTVGLATWYSPSEWHLGKLGFSLRATPYYADQLGRLLGAILGKSRRVLILDLDNTLWGGVIGDDGIENIRLGQGDPLGEAFLAVQRLAHDLHDRGVLLAISSKNDDMIARAAFTTHPDMILTERQIALFQANWSDKAANIRVIADRLSLGLSSFVFLDDNPAERALVRQFLPEVAVPELPDDPALYARTLAAAGYFEASAFSSEDKARNAYYHANAQRAALAAQAHDLGAYLASLRMEISFQPFSAGGLERITQLIGKSNQFNLTTRRYSAHEVAQLASDPLVRTIQVRLRDMFGDNGMIGIVILRVSAKDSWAIDSWLMSCRVLGRGVEAMLLDEIVRLARAEGIDWIEGLYRPTARNALVRDHYENLGFAPNGQAEDGTTHWRRSTQEPVMLPPIAVIERCPPINAVEPPLT